MLQQCMKAERQRWTESVANIVKWLKTLNCSRWFKKVLHYLPNNDKVQQSIAAVRTKTVKPDEEADVSTTFIVFLTTCPSTSSPTYKQTFPRWILHRHGSAYSPVILCCSQDLSVFSFFLTPTTQSLSDLVTYSRSAARLHHVNLI